MFHKFLRSTFAQRMLVGFLVWFFVMVFLGGAFWLPELFPKSWSIASPIVVPLGYAILGALWDRA